VLSVFIHSLFNGTLLLVLSIDDHGTRPGSFTRLIKKASSQRRFQDVGRPDMQQNGRLVARFQDAGRQDAHMPAGS